MENTDSEKPIEKIEFIIKKLVDFSNENKFDFVLYQSFANESSKTFNRYFSQIDNEADKAKIISDLRTDFHFFIDDMVTNMLSTKDNRSYPSDGTTYYISRSIPDTRIRNYEENYKQLIELFLNSVDFETTPQIGMTKNKNVENPFPLIFVNADVYHCFIDYTSKHILDIYKDYSYLKKRLEADKLIHKLTDTQFMYFIYKDLELITKEDYQEYLMTGQLESAARTKGKGRKEKFDITFKSICL